MPRQMTDSSAAVKPAPAAARSAALVGVFRTLADHHRELAALLAELQQEAANRATMWPVVRRELLAHEHGEVRELYPVLRQFDELRAFAEHHDEEARELDALICRLDLLDPRSASWTQVLHALIRTVLHHAQDEEEQRIFPAAQQAIGEARAIELDRKVLLAVQQLALPHAH
jgi:hemerythrin superfamily protein